MYENVNIDIFQEYNYFILRAGCQRSFVIGWQWYDVTILFLQQYFLIALLKPWLYLWCCPRSFVFQHISRLWYKLLSYILLYIQIIIISFCNHNVLLQTLRQNQDYFRMTFYETNMYLLRTNTAQAITKIYLFNVSLYSAQNSVYS